MQNLNFRRKHYITLAIVGILIFTNPSRSSFMSYLHEDDSSGAGRDFNGIIFSVYSNEKLTEAQIKRFLSGKNVSPRKVFYIGVLGNFFKSPFKK
ncbi:hypothetical protein ABDJ41_00110 [Pedobacter sp. ASV1-7]|uniref:hypothetical protein n=1 Tax=Pedobacter sp. ASV1-7 TaxID=3145237 RepID=UPI0032E85640